MSNPFFKPYFVFHIFKSPLIYILPHLKPFFTTPKFPIMRLRRVLVLNKWRRFAPPDKHTPMQLNSTHYTRKMKARRRAMLPLHRLQSCARFSTCGFSFLSLVLRLFSFSLLFGVCLLFQPKLRQYIRLHSNKKSRQKEATFYPRFLLWRQRLCP